MRHIKITLYYYCTKVEKGKRNFVQKMCYLREVFVELFTQ